MDRYPEHRDFPSLEERIHIAHAERSVALGYAIGDALDAVWRVVSSLPFAPNRSSRRLTTHR